MSSLRAWIRSRRETVEQARTFRRLMRRATSERSPCAREDFDVEGEVRRLSAEQQRILFDHLSERIFGVSRIVRGLIHGDPTLFPLLLASPQLSRVAFVPLYSGPTERWVELASIALANGVEPERIVAEAFTATRARVDHTPDKYWRSAFEWGELAHHDDERIAAIARAVKRLNLEAACGLNFTGERFKEAPGILHASQMKRTR